MSRRLALALGYSVLLLTGTGTFPCAAQGAAQDSSDVIDLRPLSTIELPEADPGPVSRPGPVTVPKKKVGPAQRGPDVALRKASGGSKPDIEPSDPRTVSFATNEAPGTIVINTAGRELFFVKGEGKAYHYRIAVGKDGFSWVGTKRVSGIVDWPTWRPPAEMRKRKPKLPDFMEGGTRNPLGARAIYLGSSLYRIHGTNEPRSIGRAASSGCFRMLNRDVVQLSTLVSVGTKVVVLQSLRTASSAKAVIAKAAAPKDGIKSIVRKRPAQDAAVDGVLPTDLTPMPLLDPIPLGAQ
jgi:lipoprotein-anchoring transpeptidase ErfK/SrfK